MKRFTVAWPGWCGRSVPPGRSRQCRLQNPSNPWATSAAEFPTANPPGWYTNTYWYAWYNPWYAYYNYSHGPYVNWMAGRGYAMYGYLAPGSGPLAPPTPPAEVSISLPATAKLIISGSPVAGTGAVRSFLTPPLVPNQEYGYEMTVEEKKDGTILTATKKVTVRSGERVEVKFVPADFGPSRNSLPINQHQEH